MAKIVRVIPSDVQTEIGQQHTRPFHLVELYLATGTLYLSEEAQVSHGGNTYIETAVRVNAFTWTADGEQSGTIDVFNENRGASALVLNNGIADVPIKIYLCNRKADGSFTTPVLYINGVCNSVQLTTTGANIDVLTSKGSTEFLPNKYFTPEEGFNHLPPEGTIIQWNGEKFILEGDD